MSPERFFRWSIWTPLVLPAVTWILLALAKLSGLPFEVGDVLGFFFLATLFGGLPYLIVGGALAWLLRKATLRRLQMVSLCAPLVYATFVFLIALVISMSDMSQEGFTEVLTPAGYYAACALGVGYAYVALVHLAFFVLRGLGVIKQEPVT